MIFALASGTLFRDPESKVSKKGNPFAVATIKVLDGEGSAFVKLLVFSESAQAEIMRLRDGDAVSAQGSLRVETYEGKNGEVRISMTIVADVVLALRQPPKQRKPKETASPPPPPPDPYGADGRMVDEFNDGVPF